MLLKTWALHSTLKGWTLFDLSSSDVQLLVSVMSVNEIRLAKVSQQNGSTWFNLSESEFPDFFRKIPPTVNQYPALESHEKSSDNQADTEYFVINPKRAVLPRLHTRYDVSVRCSINSSSQQFITETIDISEGGLHFKDLLPDWISGYFIVSVITATNVYQLMCSLVEDQKEKKRVQVVSEESDPHYLLYKDWLTTL